MTSVIDRIAHWLTTVSAPRFCPECGEQIEVQRADRFDGRTGENVGQWYWKCPSVDVIVCVHGDTVEITRYAGTHHAAGWGMPRWFVSAPE